MDLVSLTPILYALLGAVVSYLIIEIRGAGSRRTLVLKVEENKLEASAKIEAATVIAKAELEKTRGEIDEAAHVTQIKQNQYFFEQYQKQAVMLQSAVAQAAAADSKAGTLQASLESERTANRASNSQRDQQLGELKALEAQHVRESAELRASIDAKDTKISALVATIESLRAEVKTLNAALDKANEQLKLLNEQVTDLRHERDVKEGGGEHTATTDATHAENQRKDAAAFAGPGPVTITTESVQ